MSTEQFTKIADLRPFMKNVSVQFIVLEKGQVTKTKDDHVVHQYLVADQTGSIFLSLWDEQGFQLMPGDIVQLRSGYCTLFRNALILYTGRHGTLERVGEFVMLFSETPNMSYYDWVPDPNNPQTLIPVPPGSPERPSNQRNQLVQTHSQTQQQPPPPPLPTTTSSTTTNVSHKGHQHQHHHSSLQVSPQPPLPPTQPQSQSTPHSTPMN